MLIPAPPAQVRVPGAERRRSRSAPNAHKAVRANSDWRIGALACQQVLEQADVLREKGWSFAMEASYLEIYNEKLRDLLAAGATHGDHAIQHKDGQTLVTGAWVCGSLRVYALQPSSKHGAHVPHLRARFSNARERAKNALGKLAFSSTFLEILILTAFFVPNPNPNSNPNPNPKTPTLTPTLPNPTLILTPTLP